MISILANDNSIVSRWWDLFFAETQLNGNGAYNRTDWERNARKIVKHQFNGIFKLDKDQCTYRIDFKNESDCTAFLLKYCK